jgi:signal peptidase I
VPDERARGVGLLPIDNVLGRATIGFWSTDGSASWIKPWTWFTAARWRRIGHLYE